jgi:F0F1-type ATP synthase delta subunit
MNPDQILSEEGVLSTQDSEPRTFTDSQKLRHLQSKYFPELTTANELLSHVFYEKVQNNEMLQNFVQQMMNQNPDVIIPSQ